MTTIGNMLMRWPILQSPSIVAMRNELREMERRLRMYAEQEANSKRRLEKYDLLVDLLTGQSLHECV